MDCCVFEIIDEMIQNYDICYSDEMTPTEYKEEIIKAIDKNFEQMYNTYIEEMEER